MMQSLKMIAAASLGLCLSLSAFSQDVTGAGASFPAPLYSKWAAEYNKAQGQKVNYQSVGSGAGIKQIDAKTVDFGASDMPLKDEDLAQKNQMQFPTVIGGVVPVVNIVGVTPGQLKLTGEVIADIFLGKITKWNDPAIKALNAGHMQALSDDQIKSLSSAQVNALTSLQLRGLSSEQVRALEKEMAALKGKLASSQGDELVGQAVDVKGIKVLAATLVGADAKTLRDTMDKLKDKLKTAAIVLAAVDGDKVQIAAGVTADSVGKVKAGELVNFVAQQVGGKGGGKPDMAMAGGTDAKALPQALASVQAWVAERV